MAPDCARPLTARIITAPPLTPRPVTARPGLRAPPRPSQGLAMRARTLASVGGLPNQPILEDYELVDTLRTATIAGGGKLLTLPAKALCCPRRTRAGAPSSVWRLSLAKSLALLRYRGGVPAAAVFERSSGAPAPATALSEREQLMEDVARISALMRKEQTKARRGPSGADWREAYDASGAAACGAAVTGEAPRLLGGVVEAEEAEEADDEVDDDDDDGGGGGEASAAAARAEGAAPARSRSARAQGRGTPPGVAPGAAPGIAPGTAPETAEQRRIRELEAELELMRAQAKVRMEASDGGAAASGLGIRGTPPRCASTALRRRAASAAATNASAAVALPRDASASPIASPPSAERWAARAGGEGAGEGAGEGSSCGPTPRPRPPCGSPLTTPPVSRTASGSSLRSLSGDGGLVRASSDHALPPLSGAVSGASPAGTPEVQRRAEGLGAGARLPLPAGPPPPCQRASSLPSASATASPASGRSPLPAQHALAPSQHASPLAPRSPPNIRGAVGNGGVDV